MGMPRGAPVRYWISFVGGWAMFGFAAMTCAYFLFANPPEEPTNRGLLAMFGLGCLIACISLGPRAMKFLDKYNP